MSLEIKFVPLSFITEDEEILNQIKNTVLFSHLLQLHEETTLSHYLESTQYGYTASASETGTHQLVRITDINSGKVNWDTVPYCNCDSEDKYLLKSNDILVARTGGTTGKSFIVNSAPKNAVFASYLIRLRMNDQTSIDFINLFLNSYAFWGQIVEMKSGSAMPNVNAEKLKTLRIPKLNLDEQNKFLAEFKKQETSLQIFTKIQEVESLFTNSRKTDFELTHQLDLVKQLRQAFLREAMQGKLVPQDPNDEPASVLLEKIKAEKERLVKEKKIKKQNPLPPIKEEEIPFEISENWVWCRLGDISINRDGERKPISQSDRERRSKIYDYYGASGIIDQIDGFTHDGKYVLIGEDGANLKAKSTPIAFIAEGKFWVNNHAHVLEYLNDVMNYYMTYCLNIIDINPYITGGFQPKLSQGNLMLIKIPLPSLSEQQRIVAKLNELMQYCDDLEASIKGSQQQNEMLLQQVLREALEPSSM